jgi:hypothetical protein
MRKSSKSVSIDSRNITAVLGVETPHTREEIAAPGPHVSKIIPRMVQIFACGDTFTSAIRHTKTLGRYVEAPTCQPGATLTHLLIRDPTRHQVLCTNWSQRAWAPRIEEGTTQRDGVYYPGRGKHVQGFVYPLHVMIFERVDEPRDFVFFSSQATETDKIRPFFKFETDLVITTNTRHSEVNWPITWLTIEYQHTLVLKRDFALQRHLGDLAARSRTCNRSVS